VRVRRILLKPRSPSHHCSDFNWDPHAGAASFVTEAPDHPQAHGDTRRHALNLAAWLSPGRS
jgi:hypothetical protein